MGNALFSVWRESIEAILVVGILYGWIRERGDGVIGVRHLFGGVALGVALAGLLAAAILGMQSQLAGDALEAFQAGIVFAAAGLIVQMVFWMRRHSRSLKSNIEAELRNAAQRRSGYAAALLAAIAVAREGSETVLFLYGLALERSGTDLGSMAAGALAGLALALFTAWLIEKARKLISWRAFFKVTEALLLLLGAGLVSGGVEKLIGLQWLPALVEPLWDTSFVMDEAGALGSVVAGFTGYRSQPSLTLALIYGAYWTTVWLLSRGIGRRSPHRATTQPNPL